METGILVPYSLLSPLLQGWQCGWACMYCCSRWRLGYQCHIHCWVRSCRGGNVGRHACMAAVDGDWDTCAIVTARSAPAGVAMWVGMHVWLHKTCILGAIYYSQCLVHSSRDDSMVIIVNDSLGHWFCMPQSLLAPLLQGWPAVVALW